MLNNFRTQWGTSMKLFCTAITLLLSLILPVSALGKDESYHIKFTNYHKIPTVDFNFSEVEMLTELLKNIDAEIQPDKEFTYSSQATVTNTKGTLSMKGKLTNIKYRDGSIPALAGTMEYSVEISGKSSTETLYYEFSGPFWLPFGTIQVPGQEGERLYIGYEPGSLASAKKVKYYYYNKDLWREYPTPEAYRFSVKPLKAANTPIVQTVNTNASKTAGETSVPVATAIIIGLAGVAAAAAGAAGGAGAAGATAGGSNAATEEKDHGSTYKMVISKDFGDKIKIGGPTIFIYARMVEITAEGAELERLDLTEKIEILSPDRFLEIGPNALAGAYMGASVQAFAAGTSNMPSEGIISFRFSGEGGSFQNNVKFKIIGEACIALEGQNLFALAGSGRSFQLPYELKDFLAEAEVTVKAIQANHPFDLEIGKDKTGKPVIIATDRGEKKPFERFFKNFNCEIIAQNEKEYARSIFDVVMCYEGLLPDFLGKAPEIRGYKKEDGQMEETLIAFKLGLWNESGQSLDFINPVGLEIECSDQKGVFEVIGIEYEEDLNRVRDDAAYYIFKAKISLPALEPLKGKLTAAADHNGIRYENETDINLIPDILQYEADYEKEYQNCLYIINTYLPARFHEKKLQELKQAKSKLGINDLKIFREKVWQIASRAILQDKEKYMQDSYWWDEAIATAELVVAVGDIAFDVVLSSVGGPLAGFAAGQVKGAFLDFTAMYIEKPSIGMPELQEFLEKRFVQMVGQADGAFNMPEPTEKKKLAAWLACFTTYRIIYHWWYDKDDQNNPIGITESVKRGIYDLAGKGASTLLSGYIKETTFKTGKVADFAKGDQNLYDDAVQKATDTLTDFIDRIKNGGIQFT